MNMQGVPAGQMPPFGIPGGSSRRTMTGRLQDSTPHTVIYSDLFVPAGALTAPAGNKLHEAPWKEAPTGPVKVLLVSEDRSFRAMMRAFLQHAGLRVRCCRNPAAAVDLMERETDTGLLLIDLQPAGAMDLRLLDRLSSMFSGLPAIAVLAPEVDSSAVADLESPPWKFLNHPVVLPELLGLIWQTLEPLLSKQGCGSTPHNALVARGGDAPRQLDRCSFPDQVSLSTWTPLGLVAQKAARNVDMSPRKTVRILSICDDDGIRFSRELVLMQEGYQVESISSHAQLDRDWVRSFHIAVLCHTLDSERAARLATFLRRYNPEIRVLRVHSIRSFCDPLYDVDCEVLPGPSELLLAVQSLCDPTRTTQGQAGRKPA